MSFQITFPLHLHIAGTPVPGTGVDHPIVDPATGQTLGAYSTASATDVDTAVIAATEALSGEWARLPGSARGQLLHRLADLVDEHAEELAALESTNTGKPLTLMQRYEVPMTSAILRYNAGWAGKLTGETRDVSLPGQWQAMTLREPLGVVGLITPWNNPLVMAAAKLAPALAAGCTAVLKPSELTPVTSLRLAELAADAGIPAGVINVVPGLGADAGQAMCDHPSLRKISFTGSTAVGEHIQRATAGTHKRLSLELGGKSPVFIFEDADLDAAIAGSAASIFANSGQVCAAGSRLYVQASVADRVLAGLAEAAGRLTLGGPFDDGVTTGPLISRAQQERVHSYIKQGYDDGARLVAGSLPSAKISGGFFVQPTILAETTEDMSVVREEIFGPVLTVQTFEEPEDIDGLLARANSSEYGLSSYIWTSNLSRALRLAQGIRSGNVRVNAHTGMDVNMPFGGYGASGYGKENGREGVEAYTELKSVAIRLGD